MQAPDPMRPEFSVQRQLDAYNARDVDAFMRWWADDCHYHFPDRLLASGTAQIRERHVARFLEPNLQGCLVRRTTVVDMVVDQEVVMRTFPGGPGEADVIAIYLVKDGKIANAWFSMGPHRPIPHSHQAVQTASRDLRVCVVGDSFVNGTGDDDGLGWAGRVCRKSRGWRAYPAGHDHEEPRRCDRDHRRANAPDSAFAARIGTQVQRNPDVRLICA